MLFALIFQDKPDHGHVRSKFSQAHIDWLEQHQDVILVGGSLRNEPNVLAKGGLWIAESESKSQLEKLLKTDPFYVNGLRLSYEILHWSKSHADRKVSI